MDGYGSKKMNYRAVSSKKIKLDYKTSLRIIFHKESVVKKPKACINVKHCPCFQET